MLGALRILLMVFVVLTVIYVCLSLYSRAARRDKLEAEWDEGGIETPRETFVQDGLREYDTSLRRKLILGVYVVPITLICLIIYLTNFA
ncbi:MAG: hypothetical protein AAFV87_01700 [Pseudomonadota bacterium]